MKDLRHWLALVRTPGLGWPSLDAMLAEFGTPGALFTLNPRQLTPFDLSPKTRDALQNPDWERVDTDIAWMEDSGTTLVPATSKDYPEFLRGIDHPPIALFARGDVGLLTDYQLAIVGSRNPTRGGTATAADFAGTLARAGLVITSGLASGIDAAAHAGALDAGGGTIAVCGTGLDRLYPASNKELGERIVAEGLMISEFPPGTSPRPENFPRRNRIISGMSLGTLVVEAAQRSGSLITARLASEQGREVFAIPGSIHNPLARGCHRLIRDGAKLVESAADVLEDIRNLASLPTQLADTITSPEAEEEDSNDPDYERVLQTLGFDPTPVDVIVAQTGLKADVISSMLLILELQGRVEASPGGRYARVN
ncbi:MAG: DNA-processing protein DprA [Gammaproteobacteria bacterium]|nr:DNA-processing protein DprA [Gammaproteobacteria bacterium]